MEQNLKDNKPLLIYWESSRYHIILLISLIAFIICYTRPWMVMGSLTALVGMIAAEIPLTMFGIGALLGFVLIIPLILAVLSIVSVVIKKNAKLLTVITGLVMILYWCILFLIYSIGKIGSAVGLDYSFSLPFKLVLPLSIIIFITGILLPEKRLKESKGYILINKEIDKNYYNIGVRIANALLVPLLLFTPFIKYNPELVKYMGKTKVINNFLIDKIHIDVGIDKFIWLLGAIMLLANILLKVIPVMLTIIYLIKSRRAEGNLRLNKGTTIYILVVFGFLWMMIKGIDQILVISLFCYVAVFISAGLMIASAIVSDSLKIEKAKQIVNSVKEKTTVITDKVREKTSEAIPFINESAGKAAADLMQITLETADALKDVSGEAVGEILKESNIFD